MSMSMSVNGMEWNRMEGNKNRRKNDLSPYPSLHKTGMSGRSMEVILHANFILYDIPFLLTVSSVQALHVSQIFLVLNPCIFH